MTQFLTLLLVLLLVQASPRLSPEILCSPAFSPWLSTAGWSLPGAGISQPGTTASPPGAVTGRCLGSPVGSSVVVVLRTRDERRGAFVTTLRYARYAGARDHGARIVALYPAPPDSATVLCVDELGPVTPRNVPPAPGWSADEHRIKVPLDYERGPDKVWIYGPLCMENGQGLT